MTCLLPADSVGIGEVMTMDLTPAVDGKYGAPMGRQLINITTFVDSY